MVRFVPVNEEILPKARYEGEIINANCNGTSNSGNPQIILTIMVSGKKDDGTTVCNTIYDYFPLIPKMLYKIRAVCRITGLFEKYQAGELFDEDFIGKKLLVDVEEEIYKGKEQNKIAGYALISEGISPLTAKDGANIMLVPNKNPSQQTMEPPPADSDIPF